MEFKVRWEETVSKLVMIDADSEAEAIEKFKSGEYDQTEVIETDSDFVGSLEIE